MTRLLVGAYTADAGGSASGIGLVVDDADGFRFVGTLVEVESPSWVAVRGDAVFAASEFAGRIESFRWAGDALVATGGASAEGDSPCHLTFAGDDLLAACYGDGLVARLPVVDGVVQPAAQVLRPEAPHGVPNMGGPHAHASLVLPDGRIVTTDLGTDHLLVHERDASGDLVRTAVVEVPEGSGPRHLVRHPSGAVLVLTEHSRELLVFDDALQLRHTVALGGGAGDTAAEVQLTADGRFAVVGLRGVSELVVVALDPEPVAARVVHRTSAVGEKPRHHAVVGDLVYVACQASSQVTRFGIADDGALTWQATIDVPSPTHLLPIA